MLKTMIEMVRRSLVVTLIATVLALVAGGLIVGTTPALPSSIAAEQVGCGANFTPLIQPSENLGICILRASVSDLVDAIQDPLSLVPAIISACLSYGEATLAQVIQIIEQALSASPVVDAGADGGVVSVSTVRLQKVHAAALVMSGKASSVTIVKPAGAK
jgi:hypothetical protein